jgi:hypothetical protein
VRRPFFDEAVIEPLFSSYVRKPVDPEPFIQTVASVISRIES